MLITDAAVREAAATLARYLGESWAIDSEAPADGAAHLNHPDGRTISFRPVFGGKSAQLWITGNSAPTLPDNATPTEQDAHEAHIGMRLPEGHRYNKATTLITDEDEDPTVIILRTLQEHLLPAFEYKPHYVGHRPWAELFAKALDALNDESATTAPGTSLRDCGPEAHTRPHDEHPDSKNDSEPEPEPESDADPAAKGETGTDNDTVRDAPDSPVPATEPAFEDAGQKTDTASEPAQEPTGDGEPSATTTNRRPRKRTTKRRPKASTT
ncbi:hypothetical protein [Streptomyces sp. NPDC127084]|uniref:hypothetical protein n=1 Tax=Streptomyces sp. NPDC127084 TaxID=3347133 RepID=UPI003667001E